MLPRHEQRPLCLHPGESQKMCAEFKGKSLGADKIGFPIVQSSGSALKVQAAQLVIGPILGGLFSLLGLLPATLATLTGTVGAWIKFRMDREKLFPKVQRPGCIISKRRAGLSKCNKSVTSCVLCWRPLAARVEAKGAQAVAGSRASQGCRVILMLASGHSYRRNSGAPGLQRRVCSGMEEALSREAFGRTRFA